MSNAPSTFVRRILLPVSPAEAFAWHERPGAFHRLTPPWEPVTLVSHAGGLRDGARVEVRIGLAGPFSLNAVYRHERYREGELFCDVQERGPFQEWRHEHRFLPGHGGADSCVLEDAITYRLPAGGGLVDGTIRRRLERLFTYRHAVTKRDLERNGQAGTLKPKIILVSGASGLIGAALAHRLTTRGHTVRTLGRGKKSDVVWDPVRETMDTQALEGVEAVIHLAGEPVARRWTPSHKQRVLDSRRQGTRFLVRSLQNLPRPPECFLCASGINFYGHQLPAAADESSPSGEGFLAEVCRVWEEAALEAGKAGMRVCLMRTGIVLSPAGGALGLMVKPFQAGLGGPAGPGSQRMSWIGLDDLLDLYLLAVEDCSLSGPVNAIAPQPVTNREFAQTLGKVLRRPALLRLPAAVIHLALGDMGREMLLADLPVRSKVLEERKFPFRHPSLEPYLRFILGRMKSPAEETL